MLKLKILIFIIIYGSDDPMGSIWTLSPLRANSVTGQCSLAGFLFSIHLDRGGAI